MKIRIDPLTVVMFLAAAAAGNMRLLCLTYVSAAAHECAHLAAALAIGLKPERMSFSPFGARLDLKNKLVRSFADEIIVYAAGPLFNASAALAALFAGREELYRINTALFAMNLLPAAPLDGGIMLKRVLSYRFGAAAAKRVTAALSAVIAAALLSAAVVGLYHGMINFSMFMMALFLLGNLVTGKELYNVDFINAVAGAEKHSNRARLVIVDGRHTPLDAVRLASPSAELIAAVLDEDGRLAGFMTERELIDAAGQKIGEPK